jgi:hypothetical protein
MKQCDMRVHNLPDRIGAVIQFFGAKGYQQNEIHERTHAAYGNMCLQGSEYGVVFEVLFRAAGKGW